MTEHCKYELESLKQGYKGEFEPRLPSGDDEGDWSCAWGAILKDVPENVVHLAACIFGDNDGPDWIWVFLTDDGSWNFLKAGCDYSGWDCRSWGFHATGFYSYRYCVENIPDADEAMRENLIRQIKGESPYALSETL